MYHSFKSYDFHNLWKDNGGYFADDDGNTRFTYSFSMVTAPDLSLNAGDGVEEIFYALAKSDGFPECEDNDFSLTVSKTKSFCYKNKITYKENELSTKFNESEGIRNIVHSRFSFESKFYEIDSNLTIGNSESDEIYILINQVGQSPWALIDHILNWSYNKTLSNGFVSELMTFKSEFMNIHLIGKSDYKNGHVKQLSIFFPNSDLTSFKLLIHFPKSEMYTMHLNLTTSTEYKLNSTLKSNLEEFSLILNDTSYTTEPYEKISHLWTTPFFKLKYSDRGNILNLFYTCKTRRDVGQGYNLKEMKKIIQYLFKWIEDIKELIYEHEYNLFYMLNGLLGEDLSSFMCPSCSSPVLWEKIMDLANDIQGK